MLLQQITIFEPTKFAYFPNSECPCVEIHQNQQYIAFSTRAHELILYNQKFGRTSNLFKSEHGIVDIKFTSELILVIQKGYHQILCFSLKTQKLKKKITGNRSQILSLSYCPQRRLFCCITHESCSIYNEFTLNRQKLIKCSTSSFIDCLFGQNGQYLFTGFKDSTFFIWDLESYKYEEYRCEGKDLKIASNSSGFISLYSLNNIMIADLNRQCVFQNIEKFWDSNIQKVDFIDNILLLQTQTTFYIAQVFNQAKFLLQNVKAVEKSITTFRVSGFGSIILLLSNKAKKISTFQIVDENRKMIVNPKNPLQNKGLVCCGGYSNTSSCVISDNIQMTTIKGSESWNYQKLSINSYHPEETSNFSIDKFQDFLVKHHIFPDKYRASAYKFILQLPISFDNFRKLQRKGLHECVEFLDKKYPLENKKITIAIKQIISLLAHSDPIFAELQQLPQIVFPFVCLFGQDECLCFQVVYRVMTHWMSFLFEQFPIPNSHILQNLYEILEQNDAQMVKYLKNKNIPFTKLAWSMLSTLFTANLSKEAFLALIDNLIVHPQQPQFMMFILLGYLSYNRSRILQIKSQEHLDKFLEEQHTVSTPKFMKHVYAYYKTQKPKVIYKNHIFDFSERQYLQMRHYPKDALAMCQNRRRIEAQEFRKQDQQELYRQKLTGQMQKMTLQAKRNAQREMLMAQSFNYHTSIKQKSRIEPLDKQNKQKVRLEKILHLQKLIDELSNVLQNQKQAKNVYKNCLPFLMPKNNLYDQSDKELDDLALKVMNQLTALKPNLLKKPLNSLPLTEFHDRPQNSSSAFKTLMNAQITNKLWEIDSLDHQTQQKKWESEMLKSMKT